MKPQRSQRNPLCPQKSRDIGRRRIDSFVEDEVVFELKALEALARIYEAQALSYIRRREKERDGGRMLVYGGSENGETDESFGGHRGKGRTILLIC